MHYYAKITVTHKPKNALQKQLLRLGQDVDGLLVSEFYPFKQKVLNRIDLANLNHPKCYPLPTDHAFVRACAVDKFTEDDLILYLGYVCQVRLYRVRGTFDKNGLAWEEATLEFTENQTTP